MRLDEEEVLIRDDSGLLHGGDCESSYPVRQNGWFQKLTRTLSLSLGFFVLGLCFAIPGPTLLDLGDRVEATVGQMMMMFAARSAGYLLGAIAGGVLFDCFDKQLLLFCTLLISSVATVSIPWSLTLVVMATMFGLQGITMGVLDTGGNIFCIRLWGKKSGPYIQTLHFAFGIGAFIAPLLATPFLSQEMVTHNSSFLEGNIPVSPFFIDKMRHNRSVRTDNILDELKDPDFSNLLNVINTQNTRVDSHRVKRNDETTGITTLSSTVTETTHGNTKNINISLTGRFNDSSNLSHKVEHKLQSDNETLGEKPITVVTNINASPSTSPPVTIATSSNASSTVLLTTSTKATSIEVPVDPGAGRKPSAATDNDLKPSFTDGEKMILKLDKHKDEKDTEGQESPNTPSEHVNVTDTTVSTPSSAITISSELLNSSVSASSVNVSSRNTGISLNINHTDVNGSLTSSVTFSAGNKSTAGVTVAAKSTSNSSSTASPSSTLPKQPASTTRDQTIISSLSGNNSLAKPTATTGIPTTNMKTAEVKTSTTITTTSAPTSTSTIKTTTETTTTSTIGTTSTVKATTTTFVAPTTTFVAPTTTTTEKITTTLTSHRKEVTNQVTHSGDKNLVTSSQPAHKLTTDKPDGKTVSSHKTSTIVPMLNMTTVTTSPSTLINKSSESPSPSLNTEASTKPSTTKDTFLNNAIQIIKHISRIQFAYLIIGVALFINAVIFLVLYCKDKGRFLATNDVDEILAVKNIDGCYRSVITVLMGLFLLCYMGLEVTYGALVTSFVVDFLHWPKTQGATVAAIFWGSLATGRGFSIFIARCCGPMVMLGIDLVLMVIGSLVLGIGLYFYTRLIWLGTLILGLGMSSVFPASLCWTENYIHLTGKTTAIFTLGSGLGQIIFPTVTGYFFERYEKIILMQITAGVSVFLLVLFIIIQCFVSRSDQKVYVQDRNGFLPLADEEEENVELDLIHFDKSEARHRRDRRAKGETEYKTLISDLDDD